VKTVPLGEVASIERSGIDPASVAAATRYIGLEHIERGGRITSRATVGSSAIKSTKYRFTPEHLLFGKLRPNLGKIARPAESGVCSTDILPVLPGPALDKDFLFHYLSQPKIIALSTSMAAGANLPRLSPKSLESMEIPLPPLDEQRRIAAILDQADDLRTARIRVIKSLADLRQSIFVDMFGISERIRAEWNCAPLAEVAETCSGGTPNRSNDSYYGGGIPWVKSGEVAQGLVLSTEETITDAGVTNSSAKVMPSGTVLVAMYGATAGKVGVLGIKAATNQAVCSITPGGRLRGPYLVEVLRSMNDHLLAKRSGGAQPNLSQAVIRGLSIPLPPIEIQEQFERRLDVVSAAEARATAVLDRQLDLFTSLQSRAFSGQL
jgi:type I restriction enzyme S subunit